MRIFTLTRMRRFVCVLTASKGVVSGSGASIVVGKVSETYGVRMHEAIEVLGLLGHFGVLGMTT